MGCDVMQMRHCDKQKALQERLLDKVPASQTWLPILNQCWASVVDGGPALIQLWLSCCTSVVPTCVISRTLCYHFDIVSLWPGVYPFHNSRFPRNHFADDILWHGPVTTFIYNRRRHRWASGGHTLTQPRRVMVAERCLAAYQKCEML